MDNGALQPLPYAEVADGSLLPGSVRLTVALLDKAPQLAVLIEHATQEIFDLLPPGAGGAAV